MLCFILVMSFLEGGSAPGSGSGEATEPISEQIQELISSWITHSNLKQTFVIFGLFKEGILESFNERVGAIFAKVMANIGSFTLSFYEQEIDFENMGKRGQIRCRKGRVSRKDP